MGTICLISTFWTCPRNNKIMLWTCLKPVQFSVNEMSLGVDCAAGVYMHAKVYVMSAYQTVLIRL